ncbi:hypothetical protein MMC16_005130 [Acarospora aff. strigata]|nr:hypothetical protein [Acarospora aff. strigata]
MPLVVPGINNNNNAASGSGNGKEEWMNKLVGKKISDSASDSTNFARRDLPKEHRVVQEGSMLTQDFKQDRLNVHVGKDGTVRDVDFK